MDLISLSPQISTLISELESATERVANMEREYSEKDWQRKPGPERWSAIECIWHLNRTSEKLLPRIRTAMAGLAPEPKHFGKYHLDVMGWFLVKSLSSRGRFSKFKTAAAFIPRSEMNVPEVLGRFRELQEEMVRVIRESDGLPLGKGKIESLFHSRVHYNIYSAFRVMAVHQHRHLDQAERAVRVINGN